MDDTEERLNQLKAYRARLYDQLESLPREESSQKKSDLQAELLRLDAEIFALEDFRDDEA